MINAYKRAPEMANKDPRLTALLMEKAHDVLTQLAANRMANSQSYGSVASMHAQVRMDVWLVNGLGSNGDLMGKGYMLSYPSKGYAHF